MLNGLLRQFGCFFGFFGVISDFLVFFVIFCYLFGSSNWHFSVILRYLA